MVKKPLNHDDFKEKKNGKTAEALTDFRNRQKTILHAFVEHRHHRSKPRATLDTREFMIPPTTPTSMTQAIRPKYVGARNPYAVAEVITRGKDKVPIIWENVTENRIHILENTIGTWKNNEPASIIDTGPNKKVDKPLVYAQLFDPANHSALFIPKKNTLNEKLDSDKPITESSSGGKIKKPAPWITPCNQIVPVWQPLAGVDIINQTYGPRVDAPIQGCPPDCWLVAALSSIAWTTMGPILNTPQWIELINYQTGTQILKPPTHTIPVLNNKPAYAHSKFAETWPALLEYHMTEVMQPAKVVPGGYPDISQIGPGDPQFATSSIELVQYNPAERKESNPGVPLDENTVWADLINLCDPPGTRATFGNTIYPTVAWTYCTGANTSDRQLKSIGCTEENRAPEAIYNDEILVASHAYSLLGIIGTDMVTVSADSPGYVILRNPWGGIPDGTGNFFLYAPPYDPHDPVKRSYYLADPLSIYLYDYEWPPIDFLLPPIANGYRPVRDGIFGLRIADFVNYFAGYGWVVS